MLRTIFVFLVCFSALFFTACGGTSPANSNANSNTNTKVAEIPLDSANMPPGISGSPGTTIGDNTQGVVANARQLPKGTPTPGIPSEAELRKPFKPGATPTPGIPSPEELKRMMNNPPPGSSVNAQPPTMMKKNANTPPVMMKSNKQTGAKPQP